MPGVRKCTWCSTPAWKNLGGGICSIAWCVVTSSHELEFTSNFQTSLKAPWANESPPWTNKAWALVATTWPILARGPLALDKLWISSHNPPPGAMTSLQLGPVNPSTQSHRRLAWRETNRSTPSFPHRLSGEIHHVVGRPSLLPPCQSSSWVKFTSRLESSSGTEGGGHNVCLPPPPCPTLEMPRWFWHTPNWNGWEMVQLG